MRIEFILAKASTKRLEELTRSFALGCVMARAIGVDLLTADVWEELVRLSEAERAARKLPSVDWLAEAQRLCDARRKLDEAEAIRPPATGIDTSQWQPEACKKVLDHLKSKAQQLATADDHAAAVIVATLALAVARATPVRPASGAVN